MKKAKMILGVMFSKAIDAFGYIWAGILFASGNWKLATILLSICFIMDVYRAYKDKEYTSIIDTAIVELIFVKK